MCEFCVKHGEGEKWYLQAKNYSDDLLSDIHRRKFIEEFISDTDGLVRANKRLEMFGKAPRLIKSIVGPIITRKMKKTHFGQIVPIEEIEEIFGFVNSIVRIACVCRQVTLGKEKRYCYAVSLGPDGGGLAEIMRGVDKSLTNEPDAAENELLTRDEAVKAIREHEQEGLCRLPLPDKGGQGMCDSCSNRQREHLRVCSPGCGRAQSPPNPAPTMTTLGFTIPSVITNKPLFSFSMLCPILI